MLILMAILMNLTIELYVQSQIGVVEVQDIRANPVLSSEFQTLYLFPLQPEP